MTFFRSVFTVFLVVAFLCISETLARPALHEDTIAFKDENGDAIRNLKLFAVAHRDVESEPKARAICNNIPGNWLC